MAAHSLIESSIERGNEDLPACGRSVIHRPGRDEITETGEAFVV